MISSGVCLLRGIVVLHPVRRHTSGWTTSVGAAQFGTASVIRPSYLPPAALERSWWVAPAQESWIEVAAFRRAFSSLGRPHREALVHALPSKASPRSAAAGPAP